MNAANTRETASPSTLPLSARNQQKAHALGLTSATGLVIGSVVGTGVFTMPAVLAGAGTMSIIVLAVIAGGAMLLAILVGQLTRRIPNSDRGLYAYPRHEFGDSDLTVMTVAIAYFLSALAQLTFLVSRRRQVHGWRLARDLMVAGTAVLFSMWVTFASGYQVAYQALAVILAGMVVHAFLNARRQGLGEAIAPEELPAVQTAAEPARAQACGAREVA